MSKVIDPANPPKVEYCIPLWLRDEQIKQALALGLSSVEPVEFPTDEPIALVSYGPSLNDTWEQVKGFKKVMTCSGAHRFLIDKGIIPTWHVAVDPLPENTVKLIGEPHPDVEYLIASACHPDVFTHLTKSKIKLWHVYDSDADSQRILPANVWALTGGCSVGVRMLTIARFLGYTNLHVFGMDGSFDEKGSHASTHPAYLTKSSSVTLDGRTFQTTSSMFAVAQGVWHELDMMPDVHATFYGDGLIQHMAKSYVRKPVPKDKAVIASAKPETISALYRELNKTLHQTNLAYGVGGQKYVETVKTLVEKCQFTSVLDYGCGKGLLAKGLPYPIWEYDPAIPGKDISPRPADLVVCTDVLEHIEPDHLAAVLADLKRVVKKVGYFTIHTGPAKKTLPDGRNTHLIQRPRGWWKKVLQQVFTVQSIKEKGPELHVVVAAKVAA